MADTMTLHERWEIEANMMPAVVKSRANPHVWIASTDRWATSDVSFPTWREAYDWLVEQIA